jgi:hypothetical protein
VKNPELSNEAWAMRTGVFLSPGATLTMQNRESALSPQARAGLDELIAKGYATAQEDGPAVTYQLTDAGEALRSCSWSWMTKHARFSIDVPKVITP